jgi:hypothetical protein
MIRAEFQGRQKDIITHPRAVDGETELTLITSLSPALMVHGR